MSDDLTRRIADAVEREIRRMPPANRAHAKVDIFTDGIRKLVYIDGHRINGVLDIDLPVKAGEFGPQIKLHMMADEIVQRAVGADEFKRMLQGEATDATHPANWCTGTCRGGI